MEEKSIDQLRQEAQELYQAKLQAYKLSQKETAPKEFKRPKELQRNVTPGVLQLETEVKNTDLFRREVREATYQTKPQHFQQTLKEEPKEFQKPRVQEKVAQSATLTLELDESTERLRREAQELYQAKLQAYQEAQKQIVKEPEKVKKEKQQPAKQAKSSFFGQKTSVSALFTENKEINIQLKISSSKNNWFVVSVYMIMLIIVIIKLVFFKL